MRFFKALWLTVFFFFTLLFFVQNNAALSQELSLQFDTYYFDYVWKNTKVPFFFIVLVSFVAGVLVSIGYLFMDWMRLKGDVRKCRRIIRKQEKELKKLRSIPLEPTPLLEAPAPEKPAPETQNAA